MPRRDLEGGCFEKVLTTRKEMHLLAEKLLAYPIPYIEIIPWCPWKLLHCWEAIVLRQQHKEEKNRFFFFTFALKCKILGLSMQRIENTLSFFYRY